MAFSLTKGRKLCNIITHLILAKSEDWIFYVLLATCTCNIWRYMLSRIGRAIRCQFKPSIDTLIVCVKGEHGPWWEAVGQRLQPPQLRGGQGGRQDRYRVMWTAHWLDKYTTHTITLCKALYWKYVHYILLAIKLSHLNFCVNFLETGLHSLALFENLAVYMYSTFWI